jgi:hypothetical protein
MLVGASALGNSRSSRDGTQLASSPTMNPPSSTTFESPDDHRPSLHARCTTCGATASDWRHLLGVGASVAASSGVSHGMVLTYPGACGKCGASKLLVDIPA